MNMKLLSGFSLTRGTALSLRYGHRRSIDLDLFSQVSFDFLSIAEALKVEFGADYQTESRSVKWGLFCYLKDIKTDIVYHPHPLISDILVSENIRMYGDPDIIAMKLNAILGRGVKKDFWDLFELMHHYSLRDMIRYHEQKFPQQNLLITIPQAIIYFDDAEESEDPVSLKGQSWEAVKKYIQKSVNDFLR